MADTSPIPSNSQTHLPESRKPSNNKLLLIIVIAVILLGLVGLMYAMYSSSRNHVDNAVHNQAPKTSATAQKSQSSTVKNQQQAGTQAVSEAGQEVVLAVHSNSNVLVNTVQTAVKYPADALQVVSVKAGTAFANEVATDTTGAGVIKIARAVTNQSASVKGDQIVATITFKKLKTVNAPAVVTIDQSQSFLVSSSDNRNLIGTSDGSLSVSP
jgi:flagellar basal body-associated protein FliL